jgi:hypothetical protein
MSARVLYLWLAPKENSLKFIFAPCELIVDCLEKFQTKFSTIVEGPTFFGRSFSGNDHTNF